MSTARLKHACVDAAQYGLNISAAEYVDEGVRLLRTTDLGGESTGDRGVFIGGPIEPRFIVRAGDLLLSRSGTIGQTHLVTEADAGSSFAGYLVRFRPRPSTDPRFLYYVTQSQLFQDQVSAEAVVSTIANFNADRYANTAIPLPEAEVQRRIADFLDDQVARIDNIMAARDRQVGLARKEFDAAWGREASRFADLVPLRRFVESITDGPFGSALTSAHYTDSGVRVIRLGNIGIAEFRDHDKAYISEDYALELSQHAVRGGDLLMAGLGDERWPLGRSVEAPGVIGRAIVKADCYRIRLVPEMLPSFAGWYLSAPLSRSRFAELARGSTRARLNTQLAREVPVPVVRMAEQRAVLGAFESDRASLKSGLKVLNRGVALLAELKRALITAAVSGEFDVSSADGSRVPV